MSAEVKATKVADVDAPGAPPGAYEFFSHGERGIAGMIYVCPCGCGAHGALNFRPHEPPSWQWNENEDAPTLTPSVHHIQRLTVGGERTHWHGFLTDGVWRSC